MVPIAHDLQAMGYGIMATYHTAVHLRAAGIEPVQTVLKINEGRPNGADLLRNGEIQMMIITSTGDESDVRDGKDLRRCALKLTSASVPWVRVRVRVGAAAHSIWKRAAHCRFSPRTAWSACPASWRGG